MYNIYIYTFVYIYIIHLIKLIFIIIIIMYHITYCDTTIVCWLLLVLGCWLYNIPSSALQALVAFTSLASAITGFITQAWDNHHLTRVHARTWRLYRRWERSAHGAWLFCGEKGRCTGWFFWGVRIMGIPKSPWVSMLSHGWFGGYPYS